MARPATPMLNCVFGNLHVIAESGRLKDGQIVWTCKCTCGVKVEVAGTRLRNKSKLHCGCLAQKSQTKVAAVKRKRSKLYGVWYSMLDRCYNKKSAAYPRYGGKGLTVSSEWHDYRNFANDMGERPEGLTLERKDNTKGYSKENCEWATRKVQQDNRSTSIRFEYEGELKTLQELASISGLSRETLRSRLVLYRWSVEDAMTKPLYSQPEKLDKGAAVKLYPQRK